MGKMRMSLLLLVLSFPVMAAGQQRASSDPLVGCYELERGPWTPGLQHPDNARYHTPPDTFHLQEQAGETLFERGKHVVRPVIPHGRTPSAYWQRSGSDSVQVIWTNGHAGVRLDFEVAADSLHGMAAAVLDVLGPPVPTARAVARRIACPEPE